MYLKILLVALLFYIMQFLYGQIKKNNSIVDIFWGLGFVLIVCFTTLSNQSFSVTSVLVTSLVSVWGLRLFFHIYKRNHGKTEDFRYQNFRKGWGTKWVKTKAFFHVYILQMLMMLIIVSASVNIILVNSKLWLPYSPIGLLVWLVGFYFEVRADKELRAFKRNKGNKGKILTTGLYKYSRHPNYFGEATMWWGIYIMGLGSGSELFIISPLTITILVRYVSGVPMLEHHYKNNEAFQEYAKKTSIFIPWFPKKLL